MYPGENLGFLRMGPDKRFFGLSMYHQMHCLNALRETINGQAHQHGASEAGERGELEGRKEPKKFHTSHCLNYLRETILCAADVTLEPEIAPGIQNVGQALGVTHVCRDWSKVHAYAEKNSEEFDAWRRAQKNKTAAS